MEVAFSLRNEMCDCQGAQQAIKDFDPNILTLNSLDRISSAYQHSRNCYRCKNTTAVELRGILKLLQKIAPQSQMKEDAPEHPPSMHVIFENENKFISGTNQSSTHFAIKNYLGEEEAAVVQGSLGHAVYSLLAKCRVKDHMIRCLADQLRAHPWITQDLFLALSYDPPHTFDFNRTSLHEYINNKLSPLITGFKEGQYDPGYSSTNPLILKVVEQRDPLSLFVAWTRPSSNYVVSFQISVEGQIYEQIFSAARTSAVIYPVDLRKSVVLTISALQHAGEVVQENSATYTPLRNVCDSDGALT